MIVFAVLGGLLLLMYFWYVSLVGKKNRALEALSSIDVQLKKRHDLLPNILKIAKKFMDHEREVLSKVTEMRNLAHRSYDRTNPDDVSAHLEAEQGLQSAMMQFFAVAENYPELKANENMIRAQETFEEVEGHISAARRFYNAAVTSLNNAVEIFPGNLIANMANITAMPYFEMEEIEKKPVDAADYL
ncbi:LemA family protein [Paremcibacter congregatus]|uniref:LemA family protein n=1 Tax=Paremcibacter congregatus TaxID=2043170 RepID=A0A2G4YW45_9PROT|nr:LemA family protein [Paremcibacter congregatus]PHZ86470.1 LemA family protein [Paremcibacter congregatus]QDE28434.1 LemA family protein [Paremcibacter congregatus]|tara:strand:- start:209 stop:772 length:564 start_codon:yes stop_codon:yes gene_type:complete